MGLYSQLNKKFTNPFIWTSIDIDNFITLIENYDKIDFTDYKVTFEVNHSGISYQNKICPIFEIDGKVKVCFFHHFLNMKKEIDYSTKSRYIEGKDIEDYVRKKYDARLKRMVEPPIFIWDDIDYKFYKPNEIYKLNNIKTKHPLIIYTNRSYDINNDNIIIINKLSKGDERNLIERNARLLPSLYSFY